MFSRFFPADRVESYRRSLHKGRIDHVAGAVVARRYLDEVVAQHLREWLRFTSYLDARGLVLPSDVRAPEVQTYVAHRIPRGSASRIRFVRAAVRIFLETDAEGNFRRRISTAVSHPLSAWMRPVVASYLIFIRQHRGLSERTRSRRGWQLSLFSEFLVGAGVQEVAAIGTAHIQEFLVHLDGQAPATRLTYGGTLRSFLRWAYQERLMSTDLSAAAMSARGYRQARLRDVLDDEEIEQILTAVDQGCATGRRDYAVLLLAARYGLRPSDIRQLSLDDLRWREGIITIRQAKTGRPLVLPLLPDVASALIAYLEQGRPETKARHVFVRHRAPFDPFVASNNLSAIMRTALRRVGLDQRPGRRGLYLFRHSLATRLLAAHCPIKTIGDLLGHVCTDTTREYATVDLPALRRVALSEAEVCS
jgi:integrase